MYNIFDKLNEINPWSHEKQVGRRIDRFARGEIRDFRNNQYSLKTIDKKGLAALGVIGYGLLSVWVTPRVSEGFNSTAPGFFLTAPSDSISAVVRGVKGLGDRMDGLLDRFENRTGDIEATEGQFMELCKDQNDPRESVPLPAGDYRVVEWDKHGEPLVSGRISLEQPKNIGKPDQYTALEVCKVDDETLAGLHRNGIYPGFQDFIKATAVNDDSGTGGPHLVNEGSIAVIDSKLKEEDGARNVAIFLINKFE
jgi:hypothetical protein